MRSEWESSNLSKQTFAANFYALVQNGDSGSLVTSTASEQHSEVLSQLNAVQLVAHRRTDRASYISVDRERYEPSANSSRLRHSNGLSELIC